MRCSVRHHCIVVIQNFHHLFTPFPVPPSAPHDNITWYSQMSTLDHVVHKVVHIREIYIQDQFVKYFNALILEGNFEYEGSCF